jgi:hypothetical protein
MDHDDRKAERLRRRKAPREGLVLEFEQGAAFVGFSENVLRHLVERGAVPHRRLGGRVVFLRAELTRFVETLPGVSLEQALERAKR